MKEIKEIQAWKNKAMGVISCISVASGALGAAIMQFLNKHT